MLSNRTGRLSAFACFLAAWCVSTAVAVAQEACPATFELPADCRFESGATCDRAPVNIGQLKNQLKLYYRCAYRSDIEKVIADARAYIEKRAADVTKPAIILDIDETSLSNWAEIWQNDFAYFGSGSCELKPDTSCAWHTWELMAIAPAIEPTLALFNLARTRNVTVFFVTGRRESAELRAATEINLKKVGYEGWERVIMKGTTEKCQELSTTAYKRCERQVIANRGYTIIANIGDQWSDLDKDPADAGKGSFAERIFKLPNPFYYIP